MMAILFSALAKLVGPPYDECGSNYGSAMCGKFYESGVGCWVVYARLLVGIVSIGGLAALADLVRRGR
ncbi:hypothetical protein [Bradyrhizobium sp. CCGB20]|uniref:hypothetical protein n=1 Tax=Bradyrhizobium sp. CCGB20 TaxID=2949633 RepID=UPI0020B330B1|nr:hypothetical protein [Bradyrhizobium sp. CCGB20]MCP3397037.1 hypothetical protein [Bradyrhizobium sp. CCGB20]